MMKRSILAAAAALTIALFCPGDAQAQSSGPDPATVKKALESVLGKQTKLDSVREINALGLFEVVSGADVFYTDRKATYLFAGDVLDTHARKNLTEERRNILGVRLLQNALPLAIKTVRGNGKRVLYTLEDPNCGYCKKLARELQKINNITVYTFLLPMLSADSEDKSRAIWCAKDSSKAWQDWMINDTAPSAANANCDAPVAKWQALGEALRVHGTPAIIFANGVRTPGYIPVDKIEQQLNKLGG